MCIRADIRHRSFSETPYFAIAYLKTVYLESTVITIIDTCVCVTNQGHSNNKLTCFLNQIIFYIKPTILQNTQINNKKPYVD